MEELACIFCRDSASSVVITENGYDARQCQSCGLIFVSPRPSKQETVDLYVNDNAHLSARSHIERLDHGVSRTATRNRLSVLRKYVGDGSTIVEIGAGAGHLLAEAKRQGFDVQATELNPIQAEFIRTEFGIPCAPSLGELRELTGRETHDLVYFRDVISHFFDPIAEFAAINAAIRPDGVVAFETGNFADVDRRYFHYVPTFQLPDHLFFFGDNSLKLLLDRTGFELITIRRWSTLTTLRLLYHFHRLRGRTGDVDLGGEVAAGGGETHATKSRLRELFEYVVYHFIPYQLGAVAPKKRRPQTMLVIARKTGDPAPRGQVPEA